MSKLGKRLAYLLILLTVVALAACGPTQDGASPRVVTSDWVVERLGGEDFVLLHVGDEDEYNTAHLPGAHYMSLQMISTPHGEGLMLQMPEVEQLASTFASLGVSDDSRIVVYWGKDWVTPTARVALTLDYLGMGSRTSILDGGMPAWQAAGHPVTEEPSTATPGTFTPQVQQDVIAQVEWLSENLDNPSCAVIDARTPDFYSGERQSRANPRPGHIAGAENIPFRSVVDEETFTFKDEETLRAMFAEAGADPGDTVVTYCHIGQQASLVYYVAKNLGYDARMYDGSFDEWSQREDLPVETSIGEGE
jgi:thiosulfate/3-mercaptopyruvate sulfurtransferase